MANKILTQQQQQLVSEFVNIYGLSADQIGFDGEKLEPIFDFEALCVLREKLTKFHSIDTSKVVFDSSTNEAEATCSLINENGRLITVSDFAQVGEVLHDGSKIENSMSAKRMARARAMRTGIRQAGVNILQAHQHYLLNGLRLEVSPIVDPRTAKTKECHALAHELGFIVTTKEKGIDKSRYQKFIAEAYDGRTSTKELDDLELQRLCTMFRAMLRLTKAENITEFTGIAA